VYLVLGGVVLLGLGSVTVVGVLVLLWYFLAGGGR
jgi:hypothetical protein